MQILLNDTLAGIQHQNNNIGVFHCLERFDHRELLDSLMHFTATAHPSRIDQRIALLKALVRNVNAITSRSGLIEDHHPLLTQHTVDQCGLADIGSANNRHFDARLFWLPIELIVYRAEFIQNQIDQLLDAFTVGSSNR